MGFDVYGKHPADTAGRYFRNTVWWWHPLWEYVLQVAPWVEGKAPLGHYNAGDGLDGSDAAELAAVLTSELDAGTAYAYELRYVERVKALARDDHWLSRGRNSSAEHYAFSARNVARFRNFLASSGGFEIC